MFDKEHADSMCVCVSAVTEAPGCHGDVALIDVNITLMIFEQCPIYETIHRVQHDPNQIHF